MVKNATRQSSGDSREYIKYCCRVGVTLQDDAASSRRSRDTTVGQWRPDTSVQILPSVMKTFISVTERWFQNM